MLYRIQVKNYIFHVIGKKFSTDGANGTIYTNKIIFKIEDDNKITLKQTDRLIKTVDPAHINTCAISLTNEMRIFAGFHGKKGTKINVASDSESRSAEYGIMHHLAGTSLEAYLRNQQDNTISYQTICIIGQGVINEMQRFYDQMHLSHGDSHSGNFIVNEQDESITIKLIDFGYSKATDRMRDIGSLIGLMLYLHDALDKTDPQIASKANEFYQFLNNPNNTTFETLKQAFEIFSTPPIATVEPTQAIVTKFTQSYTNLYGNIIQALDEYLDKLDARKSNYKYSFFSSFISDAKKFSKEEKQIAALAIKQVIEADGDDLSYIVKADDTIQAITPKIKAAMQQGELGEIYKLVPRDLKDHIVIANTEQASTNQALAP